MAAAGQAPGPRGASEFSDGELPAQAPAAGQMRPSCPCKLLRILLLLALALLLFALGLLQIPAAVLPLLLNPH